MLPALQDLLHRSASFREIRRRLDAGERSIRASGAGASLLSFLAADLLKEGEQVVLLLGQLAQVVDLDAGRAAPGQTRADLLQRRGRQDLAVSAAAEHEDVDAVRHGRGPT